MLRRRTGDYSYQYAVCMDDADQGITDVVRGQDLLPATGRQLVLRIVETLARSLAVPVFAKIRLLDEGVDATVAFARQLESAGCALLAVHGRRPVVALGHLALCKPVQQRGRVGP